MSTQEDILNLLLFRYEDLLARKIISNRTTLKRWMERADDPFPPPIRLGKNSIAWRASDVSAWLDRRAKAQNK